MLDLEKKEKKKRREKKGKSFSMAFSFPSFHGTTGEDAGNFCDRFELRCVMASYDNSVRLQAFPLVMRGEAKAWYHGISKPIKEDWEFLK